MTDLTRKLGKQERFPRKRQYSPCAWGEARKRGHKNREVIFELSQRQ
jgi:hypothetical protein